MHETQEDGASTVPRKCSLEHKHRRMDSWGRHLTHHIYAYPVLEVISRPACFFTQGLAGTSQHARFAPPEIQVKIRFQSGFQALVDMRSHKLVWINIVHNAVLQPGFRWTPKSLHTGQAELPPIFHEEISGHKSEKASWQRHRKRCARDATDPALSFATILPMPILIAKISGW